MVAVNTAERRQAVRFRPAFSTVCHFRAGGMGLVWDLSASGLGLLTAAPPAPGALVPVELENDATSLLISVRVVHVRQLGGGDYFVGARFVRPLTTAEVSPFVTPPAAWARV